MLKPKELAGYVKAQERFAAVTDAEIAQAAAAVEKQYGRLLEETQPK
jgi:hypothetical protein